MLDRLRDVLHAQPFRPFRLLLSSGRAYDVNTPDHVAVLKSQIVIGSPGSDALAFVRTADVQAIETLEPQKGKG